MNTVVKFLLGTALAAMPIVVSAAEPAETTMTCGMAPGEPVALSAVGISVSKSAMPAEELAATMAAQLMQNQGYLARICAGQTVASIRDGIMSGNGWKAGQMVDTSKAVKLPLGRDVPVAAASASKTGPTTVSREVVQSVPPKVNDDPKVKAAQAEVARVTPKRPRSTWTPGEAKQVGIAQSQLDAAIAAAEKRMREYTDSKFDPKSPNYALGDYAKKVDLNGKANVGDSYTKAEVDKKLGALPAGEGFPWLGWVLIGLGILLGGWARFRKMSTPVVAMPDMSGFATTEELEAVKASVQSVKDQTDSVDIRFGAGQQEQLAALLEGETLPAGVFIEGEKKFEVRIKRAENGLFVFDEPKARFKSLNPSTPFKSPISSVCRNYKRGEFAGFMLSAVPVAA